MEPSTLRLRSLLVVIGATSVAIAVACSDSGAADIPSSGADAGPAPVSTSSLDAAPSADATTPQAITFTYRPSWKGVKSVEVLGAFGLSTDWKQALVTLTDDGTGTFTGTVPALPAGHYPYLFHAIGDEAGAAAKADTLAHFALDPSDAAFVACPAGAPTYSPDVANPCSDLTIPRPEAGPLFHVRGVVHAHGAPVSGYLVQIEREEKASHHMFANRATTSADGTFDLLVAGGSYRMEVLHPKFYAMTDVQLPSPETTQSVRRSLTTPFLVSTDTQLNAAEMAYDSYAAMGPRGATTLNTTFTFTVPQGARARAALYPPRASVADPIWVAPYGTATSDVFDGGFNTSKADGGLVPDASYLWGTENELATPDGGVTWTAQSMVYAVKWQ